MSSQADLGPQLRRHVEPCLQQLPAKVLQDFTSSMVAGLWKNTLAEGIPVPTVMENLLRTRSPEELQEITARVLVTDIKNRFLTHAWKVSGLESIKSMIHCPDADRLQALRRDRQPAIFVFSHFGPRYAIAPAFQQVNVPVAMFQGLLPPQLTREVVEQFAAQLPGMEFYWIHANVNRAIYLKRAVERIQRGEFVAMAIDGGHGDILTDADFFGYQIKVARGPAVLAKMTGAPLVPITVTWGEGWTMEFRVHPPIPRPADIPTSSSEFDLALTRGAVQFFDAFIRRAPEQLRLDKLARLITRPRTNS